jgi:hypothetical protein
MIDKGWHQLCQPFFIGSPVLIRVREMMALEDRVISSKTIGSDNKTFADGSIRIVGQ